MKKNSEKGKMSSTIYYVVATAIFAFFLALLIIVLFDDILSGALELLFLILNLILALLAISILYLRLFKQTPSTLAISILGTPNSGKTVYLTVLFNELLTSSSHREISFTTYGSETIERISADYQKLSVGQWLPPTPQEGVFYYRAKASFSNYRKYKLEIADYAGEKFKKELKENSNFFHKTEYFKYVISSDIVFLAVDIQLVLDDWEGNEYITTIENSFISALTLMQESKNMGFNRRIRFPVALIFLKSDLLKEISETENLDHELDKLQKKIVERFERIIGYCTKNCISYHHFFISATGTKNIEKTKNKITPVDVVAPLEWAIRKHRFPRNSF